jgi:hypothetical protein
VSQLKLNQRDASPAGFHQIPSHPMAILPKPHGPAPFNLYISWQSLWMQIPHKSHPIHDASRTQQHNVSRPSRCKSRRKAHRPKQNVVHCLHKPVVCQGGNKSHGYVSFISIRRENVKFPLSFVLIISKSGKVAIPLITPHSSLQASLTTSYHLSS